MKKIFTYILLIAFSSATIISCGGSKNSTKGVLGGTVGTVVGVILISKILKSVMNVVEGSTAFAGLSQNQQFVSSFNEDTKLSSFAQNDLLKTALQVLVAEHYKIPLVTVANNYKSLITAGDLATFIGKNADAKILEKIK